MGGTLAALRAALFTSSHAAEMVQRRALGPKTLNELSHHVCMQVAMKVTRGAVHVGGRYRKRWALKPQSPKTLVYVRRWP